jgi:hypothetical protein
MRRLLLVAGGLVALVLVAVVLAIANLSRVAEANRERIVAGIAKGFGRPIEVGRISAGFRGGVSLVVDDLRVADDPAYSTEPFLVAASTHAVVRFWPLLRGRIEIRRIVATAPQVTIIRTAEGTNVDSLGRTPSSPKAPATPGGTPTGGNGIDDAAVPALAIALVNLEGGTVRYVDRTETPPVERTIAPLDVHLSDLSLGAPMRIDVRATIAGTSPTVVHTRGTLGPIGETPFAADVPIDQHVTVRGGTIDVADLAVAGRVRRDATGKPVANVRLTAPSLHAGDVEMTAVDVALTEADGVTVLESLSLTLLGGTVTGSGHVEHVRSPAAIHVQAGCRGLDMTQLLSLRAGDMASRFAGTLDADWTIDARAGDEAAVRRSLAGSGRVAIHDGVLRDVNVADAVLSGVTGVGVTSLVPARIRDRHPRLFASDDTQFEKLTTDVRIAGERILVDSLVVAAPDYEVRGHGDVGFDRRVELTATLAASLALTSDIVGAVRLAKYLIPGDDGRITIPFRLLGTLPDVRPRADQDFLARALRRALAAEGLDGLLGGGRDDGKDGKRDGREDPVKRLRRKLDRLFR